MQNYFFISILVTSRNMVVIPRTTDGKLLNNKIVLTKHANTMNRIKSR